MTHDILFQVTVPGRPIVKKNTKRIVGHGKNKHIIYSPKYIEWEKIALLTCNKAKGSTLIRTWIEADYKFYFKNQQGEADTSNLVEGIQDVLKSSGVIEDDKLIKKFTAEKFFNEDPRCEVTLWEYKTV